MALNQVVLTLDVYNGAGSLVQEGSAFLTPSSPLTDPTDHLYIWQTPISVSLVPPEGAAEDWMPTVTLYSCDSSNLSPGGWAWQISFQAPGAPPGFNFFLNYSNGADQYLDDQTPVYSVTTMQGYLQYPTGTPSNGNVPTYESGAIQWGSGGGGGGMSNPMTTLGDIIAGGASGSPARVAGPTASEGVLTSTPSGGVAQDPVWTTLQALQNAQAGGVTSGDYLRGNGTNILLAALQAADLTGTVSAAQGGTGQTSLQAAINSLAGGVTSGDYLRGNGTNILLSAIQAADLPTGTTSAKGALQLDGTAIDIQPFGLVPAAGGNGLSADSGHVHPLPDVFYGNMGSVLAWNYPPSQISTSSATGGTPGTNATVYFLQIPVAYAKTITDLNFGIVTAATGTITHAYAGLVNSSGLVVAESADRASDAALTTSSSLWSPPLSSTYAAAAGTYYAFLWILMAGGGSPPAIARCAANGGVTTLLNLGTVSGSYRFSQLASQTAIQTVGNSYTLTSNAISSFSAWCALT
jgi:hypothetical protein